MSAHHCPQVMTTARHGCWVCCRCGWIGKGYPNGRSASAGWAEHVRTFDNSRWGARNDGQGAP